MGNFKSKVSNFGNKIKVKNEQKGGTYENYNSDKIAISPEEWELFKLRQEENHLINMDSFFPEETWEVILAKLNDSIDVENCANASPFFGRLLKDKGRIKVVLPSVFGILANRYSDDNNNDESFKETNPTSIPWNISQKNKEAHPMAGLWKCRLVCKTWNTVIEELHQNEDAGHYSMRHDFKKAKNSKIGSRWGTDVFDYKSSIQKFTKHFEATHFDLLGGTPKKCPFVGRRVRIIFRFSRIYIEDMFFLLKVMLGIFGRDVWYFEMYYIYPDVVDMFRKLKEFVVLMPNLKVIQIHYTMWAHRAHSKVELQNLSQEITTNPLPKSAKIEYLSIFGMPIVLFDHLTLQYPNIHSFSMQHQEFPENSNIFNSILKHLSELSLDICCERDFERLENSQVDLKLKKLHFNYCHHASHCYRVQNANSDNDDSDDNNCDDLLPWSRVFAVLENKFDSSLCTELALKLPMPYSNAERKSILRDSLSCKLNFPSCQHIKIYQNTVFAIDFLLPLKSSLKTIKISGYMEKTKYWNLKSHASCVGVNIEEMQVIQFLGKEGYMQHSNISSMLPLLKTLIITNEHIDFKFNFEKGKFKSRYPPIRRLTYEELSTPISHQSIWGNPKYGFKKV